MGRAMPARVWIYLISGFIVLFSGVGFVIFGFRQVQTLSPNHILVYWSFHTIHPQIHGLYLEVPIGSEILVPWLLIGVALISLAVFLLHKAQTARKHLGVTKMPQRQQ